MAFEFRWVGVLGVLAGILAWSLALYVYAAAPTRTLNRLLALALFLEGASYAGGFGLRFMFDDEPSVRGFAAVSFATLPALLVLYPIILGNALQTPMVAPFRRPLVQAVLLFAWAAFEVFFLLRSDVFIQPYPTPETLTYASWELNYSTGFQVLVGLVAAVSLFALVASISAYRRTKPGSFGRKRAKAFLFAYGTRDGAYPLVIATSLLLFYFLPEFGNSEEIRVATVNAILPMLYVLFSLATCVFLSLLAYGILSVHLFDIDLRLRRTIRRGTVASFFFAAFLVASQLAETFATRYFEGYGWAIGAIVAGVLLFFLAPLQRAADKFAKRAVPTAQTIADANHAVRRAFFEEQVQLVWADGTLSAKERRLLEAQRIRLGIDAEEALRIERQIAR